MCWINFNSEQPVLAHLCKPLESLCQHKGGNKQLGAEEASFGRSANFCQFKAVMKFWVGLRDRLKLVWGNPKGGDLPPLPAWSPACSHTCRTLQQERLQDFSAVWRLQGRLTRARLPDYFVFWSLCYHLHKVAYSCRLALPHIPLRNCFKRPLNTL